MTLRCQARHTIPRRFENACYSKFKQDFISDMRQYACPMVSIILLLGDHHKIKISQRAHDVVLDVMSLLCRGTFRSSPLMLF